MSDPAAEVRKLTTQIISAYAGQQTLAVHDLPGVIQAVSTALRNLGKPRDASQPRAPAMPAVPIKQSVHLHHLTCLECGKTMKMLKRHLTTDHGLDAATYRQKWHLPASYPLIAPTYAAQRSTLARAKGFGTKRAFTVVK